MKASKKFALGDEVDPSRFMHAELDDNAMFETDGRAKGIAKQLRIQELPHQLRDLQVATSGPDTKFFEGCTDTVRSLNGSPPRLEQESALVAEQYLRIIC